MFNNRYGFGTYEDLENGYSRDLEVANDYLEAGRDPAMPRVSPAEIEERLKKSL